MKDKNKQKYYDNNTEFQIKSAAQSKQKQREWFKKIKEEITLSKCLDIVN